MTAPDRIAELDQVKATIRDRASLRGAYYHGLRSARLPRWLAGALVLVDAIEDVLIIEPADRED